MVAHAFNLSPHEAGRLLSLRLAYSTQPVTTQPKLPSRTLSQKANKQNNNKKSTYSWGKSGAYGEGMGDQLDQNTLYAYVKFSNSKNDEYVFMGSSCSSQKVKKHALGTRLKPKLSQVHNYVSLMPVQRPREYVSVLSARVLGHEQHCHDPYLPLPCSAGSLSKLSTLF